MNDRELLEKAAKAAGITIDKSEHGGFDLTGNALLDWHNGITWNPLTNDGDALRLLHSIYRKSDADHWIRVYDNLWAGSLDDLRRAIVKAAAATQP